MVVEVRLLSVSPSFFESLAKQLNFVEMTQPGGELQSLETPDGDGYAMVRDYRLDPTGDLTILDDQQVRKVLEAAQGTAGRT